MLYWNDFAALKFLSACEGSKLSLQLTKTSSSEWAFLTSGVWNSKQKKGNSGEEIHLEQMDVQMRKAVMMNPFYREHNVILIGSQMDAFLNTIRQKLSKT